jgi:hypothetical protein
MGKEMGCLKFMRQRKRHLWKKSGELVKKYTEIDHFLSLYVIPVLITNVCKVLIFPFCLKKYSS